jgi:hypothetical protein
MPQLDKSSFLNQILWLIIFLAILYFIMILLVLPQIHKVFAVRRLILTNIIQKGYIFSNQIIKRSRFNELFNFLLIYFNGLLLLNVYFFKKLVKSSNLVFQKYITLNLENNIIK